MSIVEKLRNLCDERGVSFNKFEIESGVGRGTASRWDNNSPSVEKIELAANYFGVSIDYLLDRDQQTTEDDPDEAYTILSRNAKKLSPEKRKQLLDIARVMFQEEFKD